MALSHEEQEVHINFSRDENVAELYTSDPTWMTKLDNLVKKSPELYEVVKKTEFGKLYRFPKKLISLRSSISTRTISEEQKKKASERFKKMWEVKKGQE